MQTLFEGKQWQEMVTHSEYTGNVLATGMDDIRGQDRTD